MTAQHCKSSIVGFGGWGGRQDVGHIHNMLLGDEADGSLDLKDESHVRARIRSEAQDRSSGSYPVTSGAVRSSGPELVTTMRQPDTLADKDRARR